MRKLVVVAERPERPAEGFHVVSQAIVKGLREIGHEVEVVDPRNLRFTIPRWTVRPPDAVVFPHGPGVGTVAASALIRRLVRTKVVWIATRPDLANVPRWLRSRRTANGIVCNRARHDLAEVASDAVIREQLIGIDPGRVAGPVESAPHPWPEVAHSGRLVALHLGHLRPNRGLDLLAAAKRQLGREIEIVVQASPTFAPDPDVLGDLESSGVVVRQGYEADLGSLYHAADLYVFPVRPESRGAIELPLGVLEAVACGTPVLTTRFGVLARALSHVPGVTFADEDQFVPSLRRFAAAPHTLVRPKELPPELEIARTVEATNTLLGELCRKS